jgi:hypothetical protein
VLSLFIHCFFGNEVGYFCDCGWFKSDKGRTIGLSTGQQGCGAGLFGRGRLAGLGVAAPRTARPPAAAAVIPIVPTDAAGGAEAHKGWSDGVNATRLSRGGGG